MNGPDPLAPDGREDAPLDRTISPISGRLGAGAGGKALAFAGLVAGCGVFAFATWSADRPRPETPLERPARQVVAFEPAPAPTLAVPGPNPPSLTGRPEVPPIDPGFDAARPAAGVPAAPPPPRSAPLMAWSRSLRFPSTAATAAEAPIPAGEPTALEQLARPSAIARVAARSLGDRDLLLLAGATLPCILQTALDSSVPGHVTCVLPQDVWSDNGAVVLLEKGTRVMGEHRGGLRQGQRRVFVLWTRAVTPGGVAIDLASPATDALGRGGFDGVVDTRFWDRFGAALMLSVVGDAGEALREDGRRASRLPSDAAAIAVDRGADIAPVLRRAQGSEVAIMTARDFDFSGVYGLRRRTP